MRAQQAKEVGVMPARSLKMRLIAAVIAMVTLLGLGSATAATAQAAPFGGYNYKATFTVWQVCTVNVAFGPDKIKNFLFAVAVSDGFIMNKQGYAFVDGGYNTRPHDEALRMAFEQAFRVYLENNMNYTPSGVDSLMKMTEMDDKPKPIGRPYVTSPAFASELKYELQHIATGTKNPAQGYPAIVRIKGDLSGVVPYSVGAGNFDSEREVNRLRALSARFRGAEAKMASDPIQRRVDKYGQDMHSYFQVLDGEYLVPGTQVISTRNPRTIVGMIGAGDYKWDGADALYPMDAWVELARAKGVEVQVAGESPAPSASATASPSASAVPSASSSAALPSASAQPSEPSAQQPQDSWSIWQIVGGLIAVFCMIGLIGLIWLIMLKRRKRAAQPDDETPEE